MSGKIAEVVINTKVKSLDRVFNYLADDEMRLEKGMRVEVPFGNGNRKSVGYFTGYTEQSDYDGELKKIIRVLDEKPIISEKGMELAAYIRKTCFTTMATALRLLLPPAVKTNYEKSVRLLKPDYAAEKLTGQQISVLDTLNAAKKDISLLKLIEAAGLKNSSAVNALAKKKYVEIIEKLTGEPGDKTKKVISLTIDWQEIGSAIDNLKKNAKKAAIALEILAEHETMDLSDLMQMSECSIQTAELLQTRGYAAIEVQRVERIPEIPETERTKNYLPTEQQQVALDKLFKYLDEGIRKNILLHGVTGSGKTEVFLQAAQRCIQNGKNAIILVPEIALTPQMMQRFSSRFGDDVALLHSGLSMGERYDQWRKIKEGRVHLAVGARSAIFAPFENIGLIVVDEEHESSYKSESSPRYSAVNVALFRGRQYGSTVVLASATPSVESYYNAQIGKYELIQLTKRYNNQVMPKVETVDMRRELAIGNKSVFSRKLLYEIGENLKRGEQTILLLNRRGYSTFVSCRECGYVAQCPHCSISLTYHSKTDKLCCHYCGYETENLYTCPECGSVYIKYFGSGTQRAEEELKHNFENISILRMDADTTSKKLSHQKILWKFKNEHVDVLLGTQMVAKGLDFPNVTLVGVISADMMLNMDDYRAAERTFAQLTQVCGRAGRGNLPGRAIVQTYNPASNVILRAAQHDYEGFYSGEIKLRRLFSNPPFTKIVCLMFSGNDEFETKQHAEYISEVLKKALEAEKGVCIEFFGAKYAPITMINNKYRYRILMKTTSVKILDILEYTATIHKNKKTDVYLDISINPNSVL